MNNYVVSFQHRLLNSAYMMRVPETIYQYMALRMCEKSYRSNFAFRTFSLANHTIVPRESHMIHPVIPGPVAKLYFKNPTTPLFCQ
jgi:hypothetical protein